MPPKISVLVPVYNTEKYLRQCLESIRAQTFTEFEIVAIDDGSTDNSLAILEEYAIQDKRMRILSQKNVGIAVTRNRLLEQAQGKYFLFVDSDDWLHTDCLSVLYERAVQSGADIVQGWYEEYDEKANTYTRCENVYKLYWGPKPPVSVKDRFKAARAYAPVWGRLVRLSLIRDNQIWCLSFKVMEDTSFSILCFLYAKKIEFVEKHLVFYRRNNPSSITYSYGRRKIFDQIAQGCFLAEQCYARGFLQQDLFNGLLHLIVGNCRQIRDTMNQNETRELHYAVSIVDEYAILCSWWCAWRYALFARLAQKASPKWMARWAWLLR